MVGLPLRSARQSRMGLVVTSAESWEIRVPEPAKQHPLLGAHADGPWAPLLREGLVRNATRARRLVALESSSDLGGIALFEDARLVAEEDAPAGRGHAETLLPRLDALLERIGWAPGDVGRWAVGIGPGSFTGVRASVALAKGVVVATGAELVGVTAFDAIAASPPPDALEVRLLPAGRAETYVLALRGGVVVRGPAHVPSGDVAPLVAEIAKGGVAVVVGEAASRVDWAAFGPRVTVLREAPHDRPRASRVGWLAAERAPGDPVALEPLYVMPPHITVPTR